jgi:hypothetical protein
MSYCNELLIESFLKEGQSNPWFPPSLRDYANNCIVLDVANIAFLIILAAKCPRHNIVKQYVFVHVGPENTTMGCSNLVQNRT